LPFLRNPHSLLYSDHCYKPNVCRTSCCLFLGQNFNWQIENS